MMDPDIIACRCDMVAEALNGISFQAGAASRFLQFGDRKAALEAYGRIVTIFKEFVAPEMKLIATAEADEALSGDAAAEWRYGRKRGLT